MDEDELLVLSDREEFVGEHRVQIGNPPEGAQDDDDDLAALDAEMEALMSSEKSSHKTTSDHGGSGKQTQQEKPHGVTQPPVCEPSFPCVHVSFSITFKKEEKKKHVLRFLATPPPTLARHY